MANLVFTEGEAWDLVDAFQSGHLDPTDLLCLISDPKGWLEDSDSLVASRIRERRILEADGMTRFIVTTDNGERVWWADDSAHAQEQHLIAFEGDEGEDIIGIRAT